MELMSVNLWKLLEWMSTQPATLRIILPVFYKSIDIVETITYNKYQLTGWG